jgi:L-iditol 2-dehydrogenase
MAESGIALGDTVVVHGAGPIGLMFVRLATLRGATVVSVDRTPWRLDEAKAAGASEIVNLSDVGAYADRIATIKAATPHGRGADVGIEAAGLPEVWEQTVATLRPGGTAVLFGGPPKGTTFAVDTAAMHYNEYTLKGVFHHTPRHVATAIRLLSNGGIDGSSLVTETRPLGRLVDSLEDMAAGRGSKYVLIP